MRLSLMTYYHLHSFIVKKTPHIAREFCNDIWVSKAPPLSAFNIWVGWRSPINLLFFSCLWQERKHKWKEHNMQHICSLFFLRWSPTALPHNSSYGHQINRKCQLTKERIIEEAHTALRAIESRNGLSLLCQMFSQTPLGIQSRPEWLMRGNKACWLFIVAKCSIK